MKTSWNYFFPGNPTDSLSLKDHTFRGQEKVLLHYPNSLTWFLMKAMVITTPGPPQVLQLEERPDPVPAAHEVLIQVKAAGINRPDIIQRKGRYPAPAGVAADIPGLEVAGVIAKCGDAVSRWKKGDAVCALLGGGGYAEYAVVDAPHCLPIPEGWGFTEAASLPETVFTVWHNVFQRGELKNQETLLVHGGSSGIGITAIQLAKAFGAHVFVTARNEEKCQACLDLGADKCVNYQEKDFEAELKAFGVDVILDMIGGDYTAKNLRLLKPDGRLVFINAMHGRKIELDALDMMTRRLTLTGSTLRMRDAEFKAQLAAEIEKKVWPLLKNKKFRPVIYKTFGMHEAAKAHQLMETSAHIGKIILSIG